MMVANIMMGSMTNMNSAPKNSPHDGPTPWAKAEAGIKTEKKQKVITAFKVLFDIYWMLYLVEK